MNRRTHRIVIVAVVWAVIGICTAPTFAADAAKALTAAGSMRDALVRAGTGTKVELAMRGGQSYAGTLGEIGDHLVIVQQLRGKEFFDAVVRIDDISGVEVRVR